MSSNDMDMDHSDDDGQDMGDDAGGSKSKMTDEEKRKNFLERNRYVLFIFLSPIKTNHIKQHN